MSGRVGAVGAASPRHAGKLCKICNSVSTRCSTSCETHPCNRLQPDGDVAQPLEPLTFEVVEDEPFDPDDCFEDFGLTCMACNAECKKLLACQKCKKVKYCSRACQLTGWRQGHKESCCKRGLPTPSKVMTGTPGIGSIGARVSRARFCHARDLFRSRCSKS